jgi:CRISPR/Cas system-associated exonuclease Cas4 (RecB family)
MQIFPNNRAVRNFYKEFSSETIQELPPATTIKDFLSRVVYVEDRSEVNQIEQKVLLHTAIQKLKGFGNLHIKTDFLEFLQYSNYFLSLFQELSDSGVSLEKLREGDYYEEYKEHISILISVRDSYKRELDRLKLYDRVFQRELYKINIPYLESLKTINLWLEGSLSDFDIELYNRISEVVPLEINIYSNRFSYRIYKRDLLPKLKSGYSYRIDWKSREVLSEVEDRNPTPLKKRVKLFKFQDRISQLAFIRERVQHLITEKGFKPDEIGVILLDEDMSEKLRVFDSEKAFDFTMGFSFQRKGFYRFFHTALQLLQSGESEVRDRLNFIYDSYRNSRDELVTIYSDLEKGWSRGGDGVELLKDVVNRAVRVFKLNSTEVNRVASILLLFGGGITYSLKRALKLYVDEVGKLSIDDLSERPVKVSGLLEARGTSYRAVIVIDLNSDVFPKSSSKDMFINSSLKREFGLPLPEDRVALQKFHLQRVIDKSEIAYLSFSVDRERRASSFIYDLDLPIAYSSDYESYLNSTLWSGVYSAPQHWLANRKVLSREEKIVEKGVSNSELKNYLDCPLKHHFEYDRGIKVPSAETTSSDYRTIGITIHKALQMLYRDRTSFTDRDDLERELLKKLDFELSENSRGGRKMVNETDIGLWRKNLQPFIDSEIERFRDGTEVIRVEEGLQAEWRGFKLKGRADRIDRLSSGKLAVIDYKSSKSDNRTAKKQRNNFQLLFYYLMLKDRGDFDLEESFYYHISDGGKVYNVKGERELFDSLKRFYEESGIEIEGFQQPDSSTCRFCSFGKLCE